jgi:WD40 repeat protein
MVDQHENASLDTHDPSTVLNTSTMSLFIPSTIPIRPFEDDEGTIEAVTVFPDKRRMVTDSNDYMLRLWDLETGIVLKKMEGHRSVVQRLAISRDGQIIASGDGEGEIIGWHGETSESLTQPIKVHSNQISSLDFSPNGTVLATGGSDWTVKFGCTETWEVQEPIVCGGSVHCVRYSPFGELLAIATDKHIEIYNPATRECVASFEGD